MHVLLPRAVRPVTRVVPSWGDFGLMAVSIAAVAGTLVVTADSPALAAGAVTTVSTALAMHARLAMGRWRAAAQIVAGAWLVALLEGPPRLVGLQLITGLAGAELMARRARRAGVPDVGAWVALMAGVVSLSGLAAAAVVPASAALREGAAAVVGGFLSAPVMLALSPVAERMFGHVTRLTMREWLSYEHPLLRRLATAAPGTFQHSVNVGLLADAAAEAIGADSLLARVGGLYHDVGKANAPGYFAENQRDENPHDGLDPLESARILRAHVTDGVDLVDRQHMGTRVIDFVREHHGTSIMEPFRQKAEALGRNADDGAYQYPGPRPRSRETGIVMIADRLEATARADAPADAAACDGLVQTTITRVRAERQLDDSGLTGADLARAHQGFTRALQAMYHHRIPYPSPRSRRRLSLPLRPRRGAAS